MPNKGLAQKSAPSSVVRSRSDFVEMEQHVGRIVVDPERSGALQLLAAVAAGEQADSKRPTARSGDHVPDAVADDVAALRAGPEPLRGLDEQVGIGLGVIH